MRLPEILTKTGRQELAHAREEVARITRKADVNKHTLKAKEKTDLVEHQALLQRNHRFKLAAAVCGALTVAGAGVALKVHQDNDQQPPVAPQTNEPLSRSQEIHNNIVRVDQLIERVEPGFDRFKQRLQTDIQALGGQLPPYINSTLFWGPFMMVEVNRSTNPTRNYPRAIAETTDGNLRLPNRGSFLYNTGRISSENLAPGEVRNVSVAVYSVSQHTMQLAEDFNPNSLMEMLVAYHEGQHCFSDMMRRRSLRGEALARYERFTTIGPNEHGHTMVEEEANAFGHELEALDVLLRGRLRRANGRLSIADIAQALDAHSSRDTMLIATLLQLAPLYYPHGMTNGTFSPAFLNHIAQVYSSMGHEIYTTDEHGNTVHFIPQR